MQKQIMTHIVAGYPSMEKCEQLALEMAKSGVDFIEIQIPFSDPVADGPTIMQANQKALESGVKVADRFELMQRLSGQINAGPKLLFMSYFNILFSYGVEKFCKKAKECGCYGLIVPDIPIDEEKYEGYLAACKRHGLMPIQVIAPLTNDERLKQISKKARGFVYCVSRTGTTGQTNSLNPELSAYLKRVRRYIDLPLAVGFGISSKQHVEAVWKEAEIAVMGSKVINMINEGQSIEDLGRFLAGLR
ncbi:tryptophan synthase subunit alpha [Candidatus Peregrinibacteria bacterium]|nr:tryptophan synthase subunit alpha [Candidatus Peregrinibacteria bacterium]